MIYDPSTHCTWVCDLSKNPYTWYSRDTHHKCTLYCQPCGHFVYAGEGLQCSSDFFFSHKMVLNTEGTFDVSSFLKDVMSMIFYFLFIKGFVAECFPTWAFATASLSSLPPKECAPRVSSNLFRNIFARSWNDTDLGAVHILCDSFWGLWETPTPYLIDCDKLARPPTPSKTQQTVEIWQLTRTS